MSNRNRGKQQAGLGGVMAGPADELAYLRSALTRIAHGLQHGTRVGGPSTHPLCGLATDDLIVKDVIT